MSGRERGPMVRGGAAGATAYALGAGLVVAAGVTGIHPPAEVWTRLDGLGYLLVHQASHAPVWQFQPQWTVLPFTLCLGAILAGAGFAVAHTGDAGSGSGQAIVVGYFPPTLLTTMFLLTTSGAVTAVRMVALLLLVGLVAPAVLGGIGGELARRYG